MTARSAARAPGSRTVCSILLHLVTERHATAPNFISVYTTHDGLIETDIAPILSTATPPEIMHRVAFPNRLLVYAQACIPNDPVR